MKIIWLALCYSLICLTDSAFSQETAEHFKWPIAYQVEIKRTYTDPNTGSISILVPQYQYLTTRMKARNTVLTKTGQEITIFRVDQRKMYSFNSNTNVYHVWKYSATEVSKPFDDSGSWIFHNKENLSGTSCNKYKTFSSQSDSKSSEPFLVWLDCGSGAPIRVQYSSGIAEDYSNYVPGSISDSVFEVPSGYTNWEDIPTSKSK